MKRSPGGLLRIIIKYREFEQRYFLNKKSESTSLSPNLPNSSLNKEHHDFLCSAHPTSNVCGVLVRRKAPHTHLSCTQGDDQRPCPPQGCTPQRSLIMGISFLSLPTPQKPSKSKRAPLMRRQGGKCCFPFCSGSLFFVFYSDIQYTKGHLDIRVSKFTM